MKLYLDDRIIIKDLPDVESVKSDVNKVAKSITIGKTLFMKEHNVVSEGEYKKKMIETGKVMKHSHIGWNSWDQTARGTEKVYEELLKKGSYVDRFGYCLDWVMGVPEEKRHLLPVGTGLIFEKQSEWEQIGQIVPVQPHFGDHMIGSLNSYENTQFALLSGVTTIGNVSHYFTYEYPGLDMEEYRVVDMVKAIMLMGKFRDEGTIIHSNIDDGFGSQFHDLANLVGWCMLERYLVEDLLGAGLSHCFGNLFSDPILRITFNLAMKEINKTNTPGSMIYGNTIDFGFDYNRNFGALSSFSMADALGQRIYPSGHAITAIPVTEAVRIPSVEEIIQAHTTVDMMIEKSEFYENYIDWKQVQSDKDILVTCGRIFFERVLNGLSDMGFDTKDAIQVFAALKSIGVEQLETAFGVGQQDELSMRGRIPVKPTNIVKTINEKQEIICNGIENIDNKLDGYKVLVGSTDVHEFGKEIIKSIVQRAGATVFDLGTNVAVEEIADTIIETEGDIVLISTFNGIAYSYGKNMVKMLSENNMNIPIIMGGLLNENIDGSELPIDVSDKLIELGIETCDDANTIIDKIIKNVIK